MTAKIVAKDRFWRPREFRVAMSGKAAFDKAWSSVLPKAQRPLYISSGGAGHLFAVGAVIFPGGSHVGGNLCL